MFAELKLHTGAQLDEVTILRSVSNLTFDTKYGDVGVLNFDITLSEADTLSLGVNSIIEVCPNGQSNVPNLWYGLTSFQSSQTTDSGWIGTAAGSSLISWLADCIVYPSTWPEVPTQNPDGTTATVIQGHSFEDATPGNILQTLIARGVERGGLAWLDVSSFSGTQTSDSVAWTSTLSTTYTNGTTLLQVIQDLVAKRLIDFRMVGNSLEVYNFTTLAPTFTADEVLLRRGQNITEQTRTLDASSVASVVLVVGDLSAITESSSDKSATAQAAIGRRRETFLSEGGLTDVPTLQMMANTELAIIGHIQTEDTIGISDTGSKLPWIDYAEGSWVWVEFDGGVPQEIQLKQLAATQQASGDLQIGVVLGDIISDQDLRNQLILDNIANGNGALPNQNNFVGPSAPTGVTATPSAYRDANGHDFDQVSIGWTAPTTNSNGTTLTDLDHYEIQYQLGDAVGGTTWEAASAAPATADPLGCFLSQLPPGAAFTSQVRAVDSFNNHSEWANQSNTIAALPQYSVTLAQPSTPSVLPIIQGLAISWNGLDHNGLAYDSSFSQVNIYISTNSSFTPDPTTLVLAMTSLGGTVSATGLNYSDTYYVKFIALDKSGNQSPVSAASTGVQPAKVGAADVTNVGVDVYTQSTQPTGASTNDLWINTGNNNAMYVYNGSVWTLYQFGSGAISTGSIDASKIVAGGLAAGVIATGTLSAATITMGASGYINIANPGSNGIQISSSGIAAWAGGSETFSLSSSGTLALTGSISGSTITGSTITGSNLRTTTPGSNTGMSIGGADNSAISWWYNNGTEQVGNSIGTSSSNNALVISTIQDIRLNPYTGVFLNEGPGTNYLLNVNGDASITGLLNMGDAIYLKSGSGYSIYGAIYTANSIQNDSLMAAGTSITAGTYMQASGNITSISGNLVAQAGNVIGNTFTSNSGATTQTLVKTSDSSVSLVGVTSGPYFEPYINGARATYCGADGAWHASSSLKIKKDISTYEPEEDLVDRFNLISYRPKVSPSDSSLSYGVVADYLAEDEETKKFVAFEDGEPVAVNYAILALSSAWAVNKKLNKKIAELSARLDALEE